MAVSRAIDIWSLGCVFSIAATWVVFGYYGIRQFNTLRISAINRILQDQTSGSSLQLRGTKLNSGDYFHDGQMPLEDVLHWHDTLRSALRKTDNITSRVLDLVDQRMLVDDPTKRINAKDLCLELNRITTECEAEPRKELPINIMKALLVVEKNASTDPKDNLELPGTAHK